VAVDLDDGGVDHGVFHVRIIRHRVENPLEDPSFHPVAEAREHRVPFAEGGRKIPPGTAGPRNPQHRFEKQPTIPARAARITRLAQTMRLHLRPLRVRQIKPIHLKLLCGA
jgi:hypothetical protein